MSERLKFLIPALGLKVGSFARAMGVSDTNVRNYLERGSKPSSEFLENLVTNFDTINPSWLLTGAGEPFLNKSGQADTSPTSFLKNNYGNNVGNNQGKISQQVTHASADTEKLQTALAMSQQEVENLRAQLSMKDELLAAKDQTIDLLKSAFTRSH